MYSPESWRVRACRFPSINQRNPRHPLVKNFSGWRGSHGMPASIGSHATQLAIILSRSAVRLLRCHLPSTFSSMPIRVALSFQASVRNSRGSDACDGGCVTGVGLYRRAYTSRTLQAPQRFLTIACGCSSTCETSRCPSDGSTGSSLPTSPQSVRSCTLRPTGLIWR